MGRTKHQQKPAKSNKNPSSLVTQKNFPNLMQKLDDDTEAILPEAILACQNLFRKVINSCEGNNQLVNLLYQLSKADKGFTYKVFFDHRNKISGFMWQTSVMRSNFERFGSCIFLDAMKKATNTHLYNYIAPTVQNEFRNSVVACEAMVAAERTDAYIAILNGLTEMSPGRSKQNVFSIFADEFIDKKVLIGSEFKNARLFYCHKHLKKNFITQFSSVYDSVLPYLKGMLYSTSKEEYDIWKQNNQNDIQAYMKMYKNDLFKVDKTIIKMISREKHPQQQLY